MMDEREVLRAWGATIRQYRRWKGLSRRELAGRAGLSPVFLGEIERGDKDPSTRSLLLIASALETPLGELYLRVATRLDTASRVPAPAQPGLPLLVREGSTEYLDGVAPEQDETAFDLYRLARLLRADQQVSLLVLARSLAPPAGGR